MSFAEAKFRYKIEGVQFDYDSLVSSLPRSWRTADKIKLLGPVIDPSLSFILSRSNGVKHIYHKLIEIQMREHTHKWESKWNQKFRDIVWDDVYWNNILTSSSMRYRSIQYKIITRTHVTQRLLYRIGVVESSKCNRCQTEEDNIEHKFWYCHFVQVFWKAIRDWLVRNRILASGLNFSAQTVLLGLGMSTLVNHVIVVAKMIVARREYLCLDEVIRWLRDDWELEQLVAVHKGDQTGFKEKWDKATVALSAAAP